MSKPFLIFALFAIFLLSACQPAQQNTNQPVTPTEISAPQLASSAEQESSVELGSTSECGELAQAFSPYADLLTVTCDEQYLYVHSPTGLPDPNDLDHDHPVMEGITAWILRVPIPYDFPWRIPREPLWHDFSEEASPRGPIGFAVNGVPIFHYEARPDGSTSAANYDPNSDTVLQGELDQCGGHAGQGDDYHYHYAPICLLHEHDLAQPIAFGLDGIPVYFGTGGTDYYGYGLYNDINNLPSSDLDECNGYQLDDGTYVYYTTVDRPYTIGCHHAYVDPDLKIEPRPMNGRDQGRSNAYGGSFGEPEQTLITDFFLDDEGWWHLEHTSFNSDGTSATLFRAAQSGNDCWDFDFRENAGQVGTLQSFCR